jgi:predicted RNA binding protein YcfA (HicA-like mRNA interferase family)
MADDIKKIRKALDQQGWRIEDRKGGHAMAYPPDQTKPAVVLPGTPGGGRWLQNLVAQLRRSGFIWPPRKGQ